MPLVLGCEKTKEAVENLERVAIKEVMEKWVSSFDEANVAGRDFAKFYWCEYPDEVIEEKENNLRELWRKEKIFRGDLARQIAFCATKEGFAHLNLSRPSQIIDWVIKQGVSSIPSQAACWKWVREVEGVMACAPGPHNDIELEPIEVFVGTVTGSSTGSSSKPKRRGKFPRMKNKRG